MARHGHRWWEIDVTYWAILALERVGLAWNVVHTPAGPARGRKQPTRLAVGGNDGQSCNSGPGR
jgi:stearoyl-CoA desaturase (delta-9 desaturase)